MSFDFGAFNNWGRLKQVVVRRPADCFVSDSKLDAEWQDLGFHARPDLANSIREFSAVEAALLAAGAEVIALPAAEGLTLDALYTHDSLLVTPRGLVEPHMGKPQRRAEAGINRAALQKLGIPFAGNITGPGKVEGGDLVWLDRHTLLAGLGYRTNAEGVRQLQAICGSEVDIHSFDMPHYKGMAHVFHLMSVLSPLDRNLALIHPPLMPARLMEFLQQRGIDFVEVPQQEFEGLACNVLALGPRHAMMLDGNPLTRARLEARGVRVEVMRGKDICRKGEGGPTCITRPLVRASG
jgi:N-dimethylarginine dimethylaminohydrolase